MDARAGLGFAAVQRHLLVGFGTLVPAVSLGLEVSLAGVLRLPPFSLPEGAGMADGAQGLCWHQSEGGWSSRGEEQHVPF